MKKVLNILLILGLIIPSLYIPSDIVKAETLGGLRDDYNKKYQEMLDNKNQQQLTEEQINQTKNSISSIRTQIEKAQSDIVRIGEEIVKLEEDIKKKDKEMKEIMNFVQLSNGESLYLQYAFGAQDFTDFIYRVAVSEQITGYNEKLINQFNKLIKENNQKKEDLAKQKESLLVKQEELNRKYLELGNRRNELVDISVSIEDELKSQKDVIKYYENLGCKDNENINTCGNEALPPDTKFWRPVSSAYISSDFGDRCYWQNGSRVCDFHTGLDLAKSGEAVPVYSAARGVVADTVQWDCGGNIIFVNHNINGYYYTTVYMHLRKILVSQGDVVTKDTQIAIMGGRPSTETWDECSTGQHLHFMVSNGKYFKWSTVISGLMNPRNAVNFPGGNSNFNDRLTRY